MTSTLASEAMHFLTQLYLLTLDDGCCHPTSVLTQTLQLLFFKSRKIINHINLWWKAGPFLSCVIKKFWMKVMFCFAWSRSWLPLVGNIGLLGARKSIVGTFFWVPRYLHKQRQKRTNNRCLLVKRILIFWKIKTKPNVFVFVSPLYWGLCPVLARTLEFIKFSVRL